MIILRKEILRKGKKQRQEKKTKVKEKFHSWAKNRKRNAKEEKEKGLKKGLKKTRMLRKDILKR